MTNPPEPHYVVGHGELLVTSERHYVLGHYISDEQRLLVHEGLTVHAVCQSCSARSRSPNRHGDCSSSLMELKQAIRSRHAVRSYTRQPVAEQVLHQLLDAAVRAPNAKNDQPWSFAIVQNRELLQRYSDRVKTLRAGSSAESPATRALLHSQRFDVFYGAGTLIIICGRLDNEYAEADCWLAAENLMLTACDLGLGTCPVASAAPALNS